MFHRVFREFNIKYKIAKLRDNPSKWNLEAVIGVLEGLSRVFISPQTLELIANKELLQMHCLGGTMCAFEGR